MIDIADRNSIRIIIITQQSQSSCRSFLQNGNALFFCKLLALASHFSKFHIPQFYGCKFNLFVADFVGNPAMNIVAASAKKLSENTAEITFLGQTAVFQASSAFELNSEQVSLGIRPEFLPISENGDIEGQAYSTLPAGMETTVKIKIADEILSSVVFGAIDYETDAKIRFSITGYGILLFDRDTGRMITSGRILIR